MLVHILLQAETVKHDDGHIQCGTHAINRSPETVRLVRGSRIRRSESPQRSLCYGLSAQRTPPPPGAASRVRSGGFAAEPSAQRPPPGGGSAPVTTRRRAENPQHGGSPGSA